MSDTAAAPATSQTAQSVGVMESILDGIGDDFSLASSENENEPKGPETSLDESDFEDPPESESGEPSAEPAEKKPAEKSVEPVPEKQEAKKPLLPEDKGTPDKPLTVKDLPEDKFIKIKVDGEEEVVSLREWGDGIIRTKTFDRVFAKTKQSAQEALQLGTAAIKERQRTREELQTFLTSPEQIFQFSLNQHPEILEPLGKLIAAKLIEWRDNPQARHAHDFERQQRALRAREQQLAEMEQRQRAQVETERAAAQLRAVLEPGYREGMKAAGFPKATPEFQDTVRALLAQTSERRQREGSGTLTAEDVKAAVVRAAKIVGAETASERRPPAPAAPAPRAAARPANGKSADPWAGKTQAEKLRDPMYLLRK